MRRPCQVRSCKTCRAASQDSLIPRSPTRSTDRRLSGRPSQLHFTSHRPPAAAPRAMFAKSRTEPASFARAREPAHSTSKNANDVNPAPSAFPNSAFLILTFLRSHLPRRKVDRARRPHPDAAFVARMRDELCGLKCKPGSLVCKPHWRISVRLAEAASDRSLPPGQQYF